ncbi:hypothetical protein NDA11_002414 [Ustilago hordei]|uniref:Uncharacterized protein n=1 Tax=Ustilago hordei TaxID=120017 RepID=I2FU88_USTHO|nr:uncharacterized protein UHO2_04892 [Ustilago hordei]KAJ1043158.1 hypothetical protein NDA10_001185 [Ustilago hordei]KAJ1572915.1 hypothetical protein NDA12_000283 [Ustilago hordei]KAJ1577490.1 hypothetical protein NDA11_002414 [Ustilago hordei]KAJ1582119.1 hypothetical protein NDA15_002845 [Ustilago hordei]UTT89389.1 hypothetical protein NDA17_006648 [Ustilago hordei]
MATSSSSAEAEGSGTRRHQVEIYAHALRTRLQLASYKACNGVGKACFTDLFEPLQQPPTTSLVENHTCTVTQSASQSSPQLSTADLLQSGSLRSSCESSARCTRSIYMDIFGRDLSATRSSSKRLSRATSFASTSTARKRTVCNSVKFVSQSFSNCAETSSLLDKAASSPQLGSPERKNGPFDWHNNPTPAMLAYESKLAAEQSFAIPSSEQEKRRGEASYNASTANPLLGTLKRVRMKSSAGGFLSNGHPASSLAQDLGLTAPGTARFGNASARQVFAMQPLQHSAAEQDQEERDRVATTLAGLAEARDNGGSSSSSFDFSLGSDRLHSPAPQTSSSMQERAGLGIAFASPTIRRESMAHSGVVKRGHKRNVSSNILPIHPEEEAEQDKTNNKQAQAEEQGQVRAAADYLIFLASSPSPSSIKRFSADTQTVASNDILSTPAQTWLWDAFNTSSEALSNSGERGSRLEQSSAGFVSGHANLVSTPLTPPPSARKRKITRANAGYETSVFALAFHEDSLPSSTLSIPRKAANAEEYMLLNQRTPRLDRTPSPPCCNWNRFNVRMPNTPPNAPGAPGGDPTFHYADFVNVSPSPQPPSTARFARPAAGYSTYRTHPRTPTKSIRYTFDPSHT